MSPNLWKPNMPHVKTVSPPEAACSLSYWFRCPSFGSLKLETSVVCALSLPHLHSPCKCVFLFSALATVGLGRCLNVTPLGDCRIREPKSPWAREQDSLDLIHCSMLTSSDSLGNLLNPLCLSFFLSFEAQNNICHIQLWWGLSEIKCEKCLEQRLACNKCPKVYDMGPRLFY